MAKFSTPRVPIQTDMFDDLEAQRLSRTWIIFFERLGQIVSSGGGPFHRTLLLKDTAVGDDIADVVPVYVAGSAVRIIGVLRKAITDDLTVRVRYRTVDDPTINELVTITIPSATAIHEPVIETGFLETALSDLVIFLWDVTASDGQSDAAGVASFTLQWA